jgi:ribonuclease BN (tRNA processing enzyme)
LRVTFIGVGEACDADLPNTSLLVFPDTAGPTGHILLDCGFTTPHLYFKLIDDANALQGVWISHFHGDHFFGVPLLLLRFWEMNRTAPLYLAGLPGIQDKIERAMELAYPGFSEKLAFEIIYHQANPGTHFDCGGCRWSFAPMDHSKAALALRLDSNRKSLFYSGDGRPTRDSTALAKGADLAVHEAYRMEGDTPGHSSVAGCMDFAAEAEVKRLALLHMNRQDRAHRKEQINRTISRENRFELLLPQPGTTLIL